tara:strand:+ start:4570 stop:5406 length:837 start_codon:yes stop_codon:yes gene_type:complete
LNNAIYVTGITGFIGSGVLPHLLDKFSRVINFTRRGSVQIIEKNKIVEKKLSTDFIKRNPAKIFINLATLYQPYPASNIELNNLIEANILFPSRIIEKLKKFQSLKVINALSYHQLLDFPSQNVYSLSKELLKKFLDHQNFKIVNVYIFDTFGLGDTRNKVTDIFIKNILDGQSITIPTNEIKINLTDLESISTSLMRCLELDPGSYSIQSPDTVSLESLARLIMEITSSDVEIIKENTGANYFDLIETFPENIFLPPSKYDFKVSLKARIDEIKYES